MAQKKFEKKTLNSKDYEKEEKIVKAINKIGAGLASIVVVLSLVLKNRKQ